MNTVCCKCFGKLALEDSWYGLHKNCFKDWFSLPNTSHFLDLVARSQSQAPKKKTTLQISVSLMVRIANILRVLVNPASSLKFNRRNILNFRQQNTYAIRFMNA